MREMMHSVPDSGASFDEDLLDIQDEETSTAIAAPRNARRSIEELLEERALRGMLRDLDQDFPESA